MSPKLYFIVPEIAVCACIRKKKTNALIASILSVPDAQQSHCSWTHHNSQTRNQIDVDIPKTVTKLVFSSRDYCN
jgi:hypothetical protein